MPPPPPVPRAAMHPNDLPSLFAYSQYPYQQHPPPPPPPQRYADYPPPPPSLAYPSSPAYYPPSSAPPPIPTAQTEPVKPILRRNQACLQCRRRKLRCDAVRPNCGTCTRSYHHAVRTNSQVNPRLECEYDDVDVLQARQRGAGAGAGAGAGPDRVKRQRVSEGVSRSRSVERTQNGSAGISGRDHAEPSAASSSSSFPPHLDPAITSNVSPLAQQPPTEIIANSGYALPANTLATGRWYEPNSSKASQVVAAQLAEIRTLKEHVAFLEARIAAQAEANKGGAPSAAAAAAGGTPLDLLSAAAAHPQAAYGTPASPLTTRKDRAPSVRATPGGNGYLRGPSTTAGSVKSDGGRSSIHELMIGESWGSSTAPVMPPPLPMSTGKSRMEEVEQADGAADVALHEPVKSADVDRDGIQGMEQVMWDVLWSGWCKELPEPSLMHHMYVPPQSHAFSLANGPAPQRRRLLRLGAHRLARIPLRILQAPHVPPTDACRLSQTDPPARHVRRQRTIHGQSVYRQSGGTALDQREPAPRSTGV